VADAPRELVGAVATIDDLSSIEDPVKVTPAVGHVPEEIVGAAATIDDLSSIEDSGELTLGVGHAPEELTDLQDRRGSEPVALPEETQELGALPDKSGRKAPSARHRKRQRRMDLIDRSEDIAERVKDCSDVMG
jgi:hypothetical protein